MFATETLVDGGTLVMKAFAGGAHSDLMSAINKDFEMSVRLNRMRLGLRVPRPTSSPSDSGVGRNAETSIISICPPTPPIPFGI